MSYRSTSDEAQFYLNQVLGFDRVQGTERFADATPDTVEAILSEAGKLCEDVLYPINRNGDLEPAHLENGVLLPRGDGSPSVRIRKMAEWAFRKH